MADTKIDTSCFIGKIVKIKEDNCFTEQFAGVLGEVLDITEKDYINSKYFAVVNWEKPINGLTYTYNHNGTKYNNVYEISLRCLEIVENIYDYTKELTLKLSNEILSKNTIIPKIKENIYEKGEIKMNNIDYYIGKRVKVKEDSFAKNSFKDTEGKILNMEEIITNEEKLKIATIEWEIPIPNLTHIGGVDGIKYYNIYALPLRDLEIIDDIEVRKLEPIINIGIDGVELNLKKGDNNMNNVDKLIEVYHNKKMLELERYEMDKKQEILENDEINCCIEETRKKISQLMNCDVEDVDLGVKISGYITPETNELLNDLKIEVAKKEVDIKNICNETKALMKIADTFDEKIKILMDYDILDKKTKRLK